jgi:hypothetical protein
LGVSDVLKDLAHEVLGALWHTHAVHDERNDAAAAAPLGHGRRAVVMHEEKNDGFAARCSHARPKSAGLRVLLEDGPLLVLDIA